MTLSKSLLQVHAPTTKVKSRPPIEMTILNLRTFACLALLPPVYAAFAMVHGHLNYPFWDHIEVTRFIALAIEGHLGLGDLVAQHGEHRPATYRALVILLALFDGWDLQVELAVLWLIMFLTFTTLAFALWHFARDTQAFLISVPGLSVVVFSPVAHNNQWWGMMLVIQLAALFLSLGFVLHAKGPRRLRFTIGAGVTLMLAGYSIANGVVAFAAIAAASLFVQRSLSLTAAWIVATAAFLALYLHGFSYPQQATYPGPVTVIVFTLTSLGAPLTGLIRFPFATEFDLPPDTAFPAIIGTVALMVWLAFAWQRIVTRRDDAASTFGISSGLFAIGNAALIGFGRAASDANGIANANASRYSTYDAFLLLALLMFAVSQPVRSVTKRWLAIAYVVMLCVAAVAYSASWRVFGTVAGFDALLFNAYRDFRVEADLKHRIYPDSEEAAKMIGLMQKFRLGPYRPGGELSR